MSSDWKVTTTGDNNKALVDADHQVHDLPRLNLDPVLDEVPEEVR